MYKQERESVKEIRREDIKAAIAKAVELRALHAALMHHQHGNSPLRLNPNSAAASPLSRHFSAQDYPVFTPVCSLSSPSSQLLLSNFINWGFCDYLPRVGENYIIRGQSLV